MAGLPVKAAVTLRNTATVAQSRMVELLMDGVKEASSPELSLPPLGRAKHEFAFTFKQGGLHRGLLRLVGEDGSKYDDRRFFAVEAGEGVPVAVVKPERHEIPYLDDGYYLERALAAGPASGGAIRATTLLPADLTAEPLEKYRVLFCVNLPALKPDAAARLAAYLAGGGNLVWICGDNVNVEAYNRMNEQAGGQLLPAPLVDVRVPNPQDRRDSWHVSYLDKQHPALGRLAEPASLYESVLVYKHVRMAAGPQARVLARLDDGEPLLVERNAGRGKVLMLGASAQVDWSNLPLRPIFLPLVTQLTFDLAGIERANRNLIAGQPLVLPLVAQPPAAGPAEVEVTRPGGETLRLAAASVRSSATPIPTRSAFTCCGRWGPPLRARRPTRSTSTPTRPIRRRSSGSNSKGFSAAPRWLSPTTRTISPPPSPCFERARACGARCLRPCWSRWCSRRSSRTGSVVKPRPVESRGWDKRDARSHRGVC